MCIISVGRNTNFWVSIVNYNTTYYYSLLCRTRVLFPHILIFFFNFYRVTQML